MFEKLLKIHEDPKPLAAATKILLNAHKRAMDVLQTQVDQTTAELFLLIKDELREIKHQLPDYHIIFMPCTNTYGNDIGPTYGITVTTKWWVFAIAKDTTLLPEERYYTIQEVLGPTLTTTWNTKIHEKIPVHFEIDLFTYPDAQHLQVMLQHHRFSKGEKE